MEQNQAITQQELVLAGKVLALLESDGSSKARHSFRYIRRQMRRLDELRKILSNYPSLLEPHLVAGERRDVFSLVDALCRSDFYTIEAILPTRAVVGRAFQVARANLFRLLQKVIRHHFPAPEYQQLDEEISRFVRQEVAVIISEDTLIAITGDVELEQVVRRKATYVLIDLWENRTSRPLSEFFPVLLSIWEAKSRFSISYGTLSGTGEILELIREGCHPQAIEYFTSDTLSLEEKQALMEMVFNATYEELQKMRSWMKRRRIKVLSAEDVARIFKVPLSRLHRTISNPKDMFFTFRERQMNAYARRLHRRPGPKKTAEEYLMIFLLRNLDIQPPHCQIK